MSGRHTLKAFMDAVEKAKSDHTLNLSIPVKQMPQGKSKKATKMKKPDEEKSKKYTKQKISAALREQVWIQNQGQVFKAKCMVTWCQNTITVFDFQCGHDIPESKGGPTDITNLYPICGKCNLSMGNHYTFKEWCGLYKAKVQVEEPLPAPAEPLPPPKKPRKRSWIDFFFCRKKHNQLEVFTSNTGGV